MGLTFLTGDVPRDWISKTPSTIDDLRRALDPIELPTSFVKAMSGILDQIAELMEPDDLLYKFSSSKETWETMMGTAGYVIVRNGEIVHRIMTFMN